ncbi:MAG: glycan-binding surface protein [Dysgonamonadaceae bacterium]|nr:glycan-binding surface protein [Dysgonamonadaceae bacterium]
MKNKVNIFLIALACSLNFFSCKEEENSPYSNNNNPVEITTVHLQDGKNNVLDRTVPFARLGQLIRLEGSGFYGVKEVLINGTSTYINPTLMSDNSMIVRVPSTAPTADAPADVKNTIILKKSSLTYKYEFEIRAAAPSITRISHTLPKAGEEITLYGTGLAEITKIIFPGEIEITENILFDEEDGKWCTVTVPAGVSEDGGSILILGANGGAYSPAYFNFQKGVVHNFDDVNNYSWSGGDVSGDLSAVIPTGSGNLPKSQGKYRSLNTPDHTVPADAPKAAYYWMKQNMWTEQLTPLIPLNTPSSEVAVQMDIFVEGIWNSGYIRMVIADGWGADRYCMFYAPWESFGKRIPFENPGCWYTVTIPFSESSDFKNATFADILAQVQVAVSDKYNQWGPWLDNDKYNDIEAEATDVVIYFDNLRIVPLDTPTYSDFEDETEE